ncbi:shikimate kinase [Roseisolibacter sp. H3M3-2]|uniref:shikimate kinase n=1 Tax=Roseisolibacter sp. H3M3-2 TaxID=3031323 RepID=UPI0023DB9251|nr:shikimate kinase [Roseisolibacter sp. H3M3-2]MDF1503958.1 shikimate kinase [Roseisolibacter sp. H3M3-2]
MTAGHVILVGLPGSGKSTVGPLLAARLGRPFVDVDAELELRAGLPIPVIFEREGEAGFRVREAELSVELARSAPAVIAPGGGWLLNPGAAPLREGGRIIYLRTAPEAALARMGDGVAGRPLLAAAADPLAALRALLDRRGAAYEGAALTIDTDGRTPAEVADRAAALIREAEGDG